MTVSLTANNFHPLKKTTAEIANSNGGCIDPDKILKIRKDKNCTDNCIPTIFSSHFNMSIFKECPDYESHFCALEDLFLYVVHRALECTNPGEEKYYDGTVTVRNGISYADFLDEIGYTTGNDDERSRSLLALRWMFISPYVTNNEQKLVYEVKDLVAWLGGAIGLFVGYSMYDLSSQIIDLVFNLISRFTQMHF